MKKIIIGFLLCAVVVSPAFAAKIKKQSSEPELTVSKKDCDALVDYKAPPDTEYHPGVDVHGKPVMEADLTPGVVKPPKKYSFDINIDTAQFIGLHTPAGVEGKAKMGTVTVENGQVTFNGNPLEGDAMAALKDLCAQQNAPKTSKALTATPVKK